MARLVKAVQRHIMDLDNTQHCLSIITEIVRDLSTLFSSLKLSNTMNMDLDTHAHNTVHQSSK